MPVDECCPYDPRVGGSPEKCPFIDITNTLDQIQAQALADPKDSFSPATASRALETSKSVTYIVADVVKELLKELPRKENHD